VSFVATQHAVVAYVSLFAAWLLLLLLLLLL
jgi:hypothetical protein